MQQQGGGPQYGATSSEVTPFAAATDPRTHMLAGVGTDQAQQQLKLGDPSLGIVAEAASPISSRPPAIAYSSAAAGNFEELLPVPTAAATAGLPDEDALGSDEADRAGVAGGNRWPRQETLALLKIRSDMDAAFRDATLKGPLWENVSRKLAEMGYRRSAKKCKEKFENVHKYYKRTKEGRAGRQDGKSYRFFSQLEALHSSGGTVTASVAPVNAIPPSTTVAAAVTGTNTTAATAIAPVPVSIGFANPMPVSSVRIPAPISATPSQAQVAAAAPSSSAIGIFPPDMSAAGATTPLATSVAVPTSGAVGISFSSDSSSSSSGSEEVEDEEEEMEVEGDLEGSTSHRKRKRESSRQRGNSSSQRIMEFFEGLMKQVMQKQEAMQQRFLEAIEKREQDRMIREEAWKRQEMARLAREHDLNAQERAISASRDAAIVAFLQKITGQTIPLPPVTIPAAPHPPSQPVTVHTPPSPPPPLSSQQQYQNPQQQQPQYHQQQHQHQQHQQQLQQQQIHRKHPHSAEVTKHQPPISSDVVVAVPEQQVPPAEISGGGCSEATSSRWPKKEVLALIKLRSGLESRYQEAGPKGPLWEEISAGMLRMGHKRSAKRCKEKWENMNKYFKKVKESNKKRPEDAKTCPYFYELDALHRKKTIGGTSSGGGGGSSGSLGVNQNRPEQQQQQQQQQQQNVILDPKMEERSAVPAVMPLPQTVQTTESENKDGGSTDTQTSNGGLTASLFGEGNQVGAGGAKKPEDTVKEQQQQSQWKNQRQQLMANDYDKTEEPDSDTLDQEEDEDIDDDDDDEDEETEEEMKMAYKIQFQRPSTSSSNGEGNGASSFLAIVQ